MRLGKGGRALTFPRAGAHGWLWLLASSCLGNANQEQECLHHCLPGTWPRGVSGRVVPGGPGLAVGAEAAELHSFKGNE